MEFTLEFIEKGGMIVGRDRDIGCDGYLVRCIHNNNIDMLSMLMDFNIVCNNPVNYDILFREIEKEENASSDIYHYLKRLQLENAHHQSAETVHLYHTCPINSRH